MPVLPDLAPPPAAPPGDPDEPDEDPPELRPPPPPDPPPPLLFSKWLSRFSSKRSFSGDSSMAFSASGSASRREYLLLCKNSGRDSDEAIDAPASAVANICTILMMMSLGEVKC